MITKTNKMDGEKLKYKLNEQMVERVEGMVIKQKSAFF